MPAVRRLSRPVAALAIVGTLAVLAVLAVTPLGAALLFPSIGSVLGALGAMWLVAVLFGDVRAWATYSVGRRAAAVGAWVLIAVLVIL